MYMDVLAAALVLFLSLVLIANKKEPKKLFGIYSQPGKWYFIKYPLILTLLVVRRLKFYIVGKEGLLDVKELDKKQELSEHPLSFDAVFFHGASQEGVYLVAGAERHHEGVINGLMYIQHPDFGLLKSLKLPHTTLLEDPESILAGKEWAAEGLRFTPEEPMKRWDVAYNGQMRSDGKLVQVEMQEKWVSDMPWFLYELELPAKMLARSIAREPWSEQLFETLKEANQTHYEQMGFMEGTLKVDGKEVPLKLDSFRDHSYGKRNWSLMHRYIYQMFYLENQTRIVLGLISQPSTGSHYEMGYVVHANGKIDPIISCDLRLWQQGESGLPTDELCFTFEAGEHIYECKSKYHKTVAHFVGNNEQVKMYERFGGCEVNGVKGQVISEWNYNATSGKFDLDQYTC
ncbi:uncharacterized protein LOC109538883 isoform X2 [Dendroctonus ponderosae]|uniref:DUF7064 domain-containing protein n=1 Tax=Dendroctonus ponderosae TaxID=77166 RepID=A0AAR5PLG0_DENPD|nr:uncharacterized protein LOC109538883 isoform X2 [Dendroctonus ponderosae]